MSIGLGFDYCCVKNLSPFPVKFERGRLSFYKVIWPD